VNVTVPERMEEGIRAYMRGDLDEARRCWGDVLSADPHDARARAYLLLVEARPGPASVRDTPTPPPPPALAPPDPHDDAPEQRSPWDLGPASAPAVVLGEGDGLDLGSIAGGAEVPSLVPDGDGAAHPPRPATDVDVWMQGARELFALGDFSGSLEMIEKILKVEPGHAEAREYLRENEATLIAMYESKLGSIAACPRLAITPEEVMWLNLDHRAGFLLAQIDGTLTYDDLFAVSGLPRLDTARILSAFLQEGVIRS
jgi:tetratricopeptide (TPR) repeat protein